MLKLIRQERMKRGWSCEYVAEKIGLSAEAIRLLETGERHPSYSVLVKLEDLYGLSHRQLFGAATPEEHKACDGPPHSKDTTSAGKQASKTVQANKAMHMQQEQKPLEYRDRS